MQHDATTIGMTRALRVSLQPLNAHHAVTGGRPERTKENSMFLALFVILLVLWLLGFFAFHVAGGLIHLLIVIAVICLVVHFLRRA
jgi:bacteriorhodopsin